MSTGIEYLTDTWNPTHGCSPISAGCANCWAKRMSKRLAGMGASGYTKANPFKPTCCPEKLDIPLHWGYPKRVGVSFMGDLFHPEIALTSPEHIADILGIINKCSQHIFLILTKRPQIMRDWIENWRWRKLPYYKGIKGIRELPPNLHLGVSIENQQTADERIPILLQIPATVHWISAEPLLGDIGLSRLWVGVNEGIDWVVCGAESGAGARPMDLTWARDLRDQCKASGVPFFFKSAGPGKETPPDLMIRKMP